MILEQTNTRSRHAFTLIEVLIAISVAAIVLVAVNGVFFGAMKLREKTTKSIERSLTVQQAVSLIRRDVRGLMAPGGTFGGALQTTPTTTASGTPIGAVLYTSSGLVDDRLAWGNVQKVAYYLRASTNLVSARGMDLVRSVTRNLLPSTQEFVEEQWLLGGVESVGMLFYSGTEWKTEWDSTTETLPLPKAVKVLITMAEEESDLRTRIPIQIVVPVLVQGSTNQTQTAGGQG